MRTPSCTSPTHRALQPKAKPKHCADAVEDLPPPSVSCGLDDISIAKAILLQKHQIRKAQPLKLWDRAYLAISHPGQTLRSMLTNKTLHLHWHPINQQRQHAQQPKSGRWPGLLTLGTPVCTSFSTVVPSCGSSRVISTCARTPAVSQCQVQHCEA